MQKFVENFRDRRKNLILMGDLNEDGRQREGNTTQSGRLLKNLLMRLDFKNVIKNPTRRTKSTETLIDLIVTSDKNKIKSAGTFEI